ncbi:GNAT family N-acetyltransferase [Sanguibacter sp. A247]|uniref:GNAT family N-acetyltransferase n=1 Tax=unclassified Sanguibacter TaxID=2645534 RepID=UPI003FD86D33
MNVTVIDAPDASRYEIAVDGTLAGFVDYRLEGHVIALTHTETLPIFAGQGLAKELITSVLDDVRQRDLAVLPFCSYARATIARDPGRWLDLVPADARERLGLGDHP